MAARGARAESAPASPVRSLPASAAAIVSAAARRISSTRSATCSRSAATCCSVSLGQSRTGGCTITTFSAASRSLASATAQRNATRLASVPSTPTAICAISLPPRSSRSPRADRIERPSPVLQSDAGEERRAGRAQRRSANMKPPVVTVRSRSVPSTVAVAPVIWKGRPSSGTATASSLASVAATSVAAALRLDAGGREAVDTEHEPLVAHRHGGGADDLHVLALHVDRRRHQQGPVLPAPELHAWPTDRSDDRVQRHPDIDRRRLGRQLRDVPGDRVKERQLDLVHRQYSANAGHFG